jgi:hypothetical protein
MTRKQQQYEKSRTLWIESQMFLVAELRLKKQFTEDNIKLQKMVLKNTLESINHEMKQLKDFVED